MRTENFDYAKEQMTFSFCSVWFFLREHYFQRNFMKKAVYIMEIFHI